ncbi:RcpC/CpaB family pilus assembly protein [Clostridium estertheticum]|uniref:RcpC/CpaB family pilus assembly protein n=1 Tax=Clostridium estertheticum TaxID=238834 RepID=UPI001C0D54FE|nr:RcpC/CpaB family pilus assembly protein [Clostridium estertheticum]MBU3173297.1 hypothetical protein [Clostridium estertheticum]
MIFNKVKIITATLIIAILLFSTIIFLQKKAVAYTPKQNVLVCVTGQGAYKSLNNSNFLLVERSVTTIPPGAIKSFAELNGKVTKEDVLPNEVLTNSKLINKDSGVFLSTPQMRKFSIPMTFIDNPLFSGTLRQGDIIDIFHTTMATANNQTPVTTIEIQKAVVLDAIDTTGKHLSKTDTQLAAEIILEAEPKATAKLTNSQYTGKFKFVQTQKQSADYVPITVQP